MCGITGYYSFDNSLNKEILGPMTDELRHRGPDAKGLFIEHGVGLGHRRLSILDLSTSANQPMTSADGRFVMVYNGEIYNYRELANELKANKQIQFKTSSDSEVILETIAHFGYESVKKFNGMFAIAIYDKYLEEMVVMRDRMGIKPLYYYWNKTNFVFASELKSLLKVNSIPKQINTQAVYQFLNLGCIPAPLSIFKDIRKLESGTYIRISKNHSETIRYWSVYECIKTPVITAENEAKTKLNQLLDNSITLQLNCHVPYGVFLSGGIDSSLITAKASRLANKKINTFSIGFKEAAYNEAVFAKEIAKALHTDHHEFIVSYNDTMDLVDHISSTYDEPFADPSAIPTILVSQLTRKYVTVALSGEGGDELFFGYGAYVWAKRLHNPLLKTFGELLAVTLKTMGRERHSLYFKKQKNGFSYNQIFSQEQDYFSTREIEPLLANKEWIDNNFFESFNASLKNINRKLNPMEKQAVFDLVYTLQTDLLAKVDRASMRFSLETRVPYLDNNIIDFALNVSPDLKYKNGIHKSILKKVLYEQLPEKLFDRPKQGFALPIEKWLKKELRHLIDETLSKTNIEAHGLVDHLYTQRLINRFYSGQSHLYKRIWQLIILHKWMDKNKDVLKKQ
jgi:asparagine synthase (glutamine-hydrolysing)